MTSSLVVQGDMMDLEWWQKCIVYQIYPRSFQDSDGDGVGDIKGIISRLDHFSYLNVDCLWLSPVYQSPMADFGYDVSDYKAIDPLFGSLEDMDNLIKALHGRGMKLIVDFIPNHTSDRHHWFQESQKDGDDNRYKDFYIWDEGYIESDGTRSPPNNWLSRFGGSAWTWKESRQAYYFHQYLKEQPDLNYRNPAVRREMEDVLRFWLARGVDGFRIDAIRTLFEAEDLSLNEPRSFNPNYKEGQWGYLDHVFTQHHSDVHAVVHSWRRILEDHRQQTGKYIVMVAEVYDKNLVENMRYYHSGSDMPLNHHLLKARSKSNAAWFQSAITQWMNKVPRGKWPGFILSGHDGSRMASIKGARYADALNIMLLSLPGTPTTYQGEEIGQLDITVSYQDTQDPRGKRAGEAEYERFSRDPSRGPIQWNNDMNAGFSTSKKTWLPVHPDYKTKNVKIQKEDPSGSSSLQTYRKMAILRQQAAFLNADLRFVTKDKNVLAYIRTDINHSKTYLVAVNLGDGTSNLEMADSLSEFGTQGKIVISTNTNASSLVEGNSINLEKSMTLKPGDGVVVELPEVDCCDVI